MFPNSPERDRRNMANRNAVIGGDRYERSASCAVITNAENISLRQFRTAMRDPSSLTPFADHVCRVFFRCAKKEMVRATAQRRIAMMTDNSWIIIRDRSIRQFICDAMGFDGSSTKPEFAVASRIDSRDPHPTTVSLADARPEPSRGIGALVIIAAYLRAVLTNLRDEIHHHLSASSAGFCNLAWPNTSAVFDIARMSTETTGFTGTSHKVAATGDANTLNLRRVDSRHARQLYSR